MGEQIPRSTQLFQHCSSWLICKSYKGKYSLVCQNIKSSHVQEYKMGIVCQEVAQSWTSHKMEGIGERERRSGQGDPQGEVTGDTLRVLPAMPAMLFKLRDFSQPSDEWWRNKEVVVVVVVVVQEQDMNTERQAANDPSPSQPSQQRQHRRQE